MNTQWEKTMKKSLGLVVLFLFALVPAAVARDSKDAVVVDPTHHKVVLENDHVRVFEVLAAPGDKSPMHSHFPLVVVSLSQARARMTQPDGKTLIFDLHPAQVLWLENVEHSWELLSGQVHLFAVEPKAAQKKKEGAAAVRNSPRDAVTVDPTHHNVVLENDHVRVFEAHGAPGAKSPMHTHNPMVLISLDKARFRMMQPDGKASIFDLNPAQVIWVENAEHSWDLLAGQLHVLAVEVKGVTPKGKGGEETR